MDLVDLATMYLLAVGLAVGLSTIGLADIDLTAVDHMDLSTGYLPDMNLTASRSHETLYAFARCRSARYVSTCESSRETACCESDCRESCCAGPP